MKMKEKPNRLPDEYIVECKTEKETMEVLNKYYNSSYTILNLWEYIICRKDLQQTKNSAHGRAIEHCILHEYENMPLFSYKEWKELAYEFVLPEKWYIRTENMTKEIKEWFRITANYPLAFGLSYYGNYSRIQSLSSYGGIPNDEIHLGTEISAKQFNKYVLKQKSITNIINNMKQEFTIEGSLPLQEAFVKECNIPYSEIGGTIEKTFNIYPYLCPVTRTKEFTSTHSKQSVHFSLPTQWEEAKDYVLDFFKEEDKIVIDGYEAEVEKGKIAFGCNKFALADLQAIKRVISIANTLEYTLLIDGKKAQVEDDDDRAMDITTIDKLINMLKK